MMMYQRSPASIAKARCIVYIQHQQFSLIPMAFIRQEAEMITNAEAEQYYEDEAEAERIEYFMDSIAEDLWVDPAEIEEPILN